MYVSMYQTTRGFGLKFFLLTHHARKSRWEYAVSHSSDDDDDSCRHQKKRSGGNRMFQRPYHLVEGE